MKRILAWVLGFTAGSFLLLYLLLRIPLAPMPEPGVATDLVLRNVSIIDVKRGSVSSPVDVVLQEGRISGLPASGTVAIGSAGLEVDASGQYAIPGLWDLHTHSTKLAQHYLHPLQLANGVTGVRDMWGCLSEPDSYIACQDDRERWNATIAEGRALSPRFLAHSSFQVNGGNEVPPAYPSMFRMQDAEAARETVRYYSGIGTDFLKIYSELPLPRYRELAEAARTEGLALAGHRPLAASLEQVIAAGQRSIEHPRLFLMECYEGAAAYRALEDPLAAYSMDLRKALLDERDPVKCAELMASMARAGTAWVPTLQVLRMSAKASDTVFRNDPRLAYIPWLQREWAWKPDIDDKLARSREPGHKETFTRLYAQARADVLAAHTAGVPILIGTDAGDSYIYPGFALHDEMGEMVSAGIPPADVLRMATLDAASFLGREKDFGSLDVGKVADILLLGSNPLEDIAATQDIQAMVFNGLYFDRQALSELSLFAREQVASLRFNLQFAWSLFASPIVRQQIAD